LDFGEFGDFENSRIIENQRFDHQPSYCMHIGDLRTRTSSSSSSLCAFQPIFCIELSHGFKI
jgi:hypothetical protein